MTPTAIRGAIGFLTRIPVGHDERAWDAFTRSPVTLPLAGYVVGALAALPFLLPAPDPTVAALFVVWLYLLTGITHVDGLADLGDAVVVHGSREKRRAVLKDTTVGVGAVLSVVVLVFTLGMAGLTLASAPLTAVLLVVTAEVTAKLGVAALVCFGTATHEGLGSELTEPATPRSFLLPAIVALPAAATTWPRPTAAIALVAGTLSALGVLLLARRRLGGVNGDVLGAGNEIARVVALHAGVIAWTQF